MMELEENQLFIDMVSKACDYPRQKPFLHVDRKAKLLMTQKQWDDLVQWLNDHPLIGK